MQRAYLLEDCLCSCSIIHTTLETLDFFPPDDPIRQEMSDIIEDARKTLSQRLRAVVDGFLQSHEYLSFLDTSTLALLEKGISGAKLNSFLRLNVFLRNETYLLLLQDGEAKDREKLLALPLNLLFAMQGKSLCTRAEDPKNTLDLLAFEQEVYRPFLQLMFLTYAVDNPMFYH